MKVREGGLIEAIGATLTGASWQPAVQLAGQRVDYPVELGVHRRRVGLVMDAV